MISEKPMMALSGVRSSAVAHIGEEFRFGLVGILGAGFLLAVFLGEVGELPGLEFERLLGAAQIGDGRDQALLAVDQAGLVALDGGDVGADRNIAAVLGAPLTLMCSQRPSSSWASKVRAAGIARAFAGGMLAGRLGAELRLAAGGDDLVIGHAGSDRLVGEVVQRLEVRIAQHQPVVGVPQHEGLRNGLDGIAQPHVRRRGLFRHRLLLGDVDGDAEQMEPGLVGLARDLGGYARAAAPQWPAAWRSLRKGAVDPDWVLPSAIWVASS